jgi:hypothetical protein
MKAVRGIRDPEVQLLADIAGKVRADYAKEDLAWEGSPFAWIKTRPSSRQVGTIGERLVAGYLAAKDFDVVRCPDSEADCIVSGHRVEVKFSTLWAAGFYKFQQLRDQRYDVAVCLGVSPFDAHCWAIPKTVILEGRGRLEGLRSRHGGQRGRDTQWLTVQPGRAPRWLGPYGGTLREAMSVLARLVKRR